ncbi:MAG: DNA polymerase III subunit alpha, partial [Limosilactobacillus sp.]|nr:DNA polymerase III subunit alpha [Limosilactobacillus sp.]
MVPLQVKSMYSLLQSPIRPQQLVTAVKEQGYSAVALADDRVLYGAYDFYQAATKEQLNPLMGAQFHLQFGALMTQSLHVLAYAMSKDGYQTLMRWASKQLTAPDQANLAWETVQADTKDLLLVIPPQLLATDAEQIASLNHLQATFGDRLYLGISLEQDTAQRAVVQSLAQETNLPIVACERVDYLQPTDHFATQVLHAIGAKQAVAEPLVAAQQLGTAFLKPAAQVEQAYEALGLGEAVANNTAVAARCHWELTLQAPVLPKFPTPNGEAAIDYLRTQCLAGLNQRTLAPGKTVANYEQRLNRELATIDQMGFADYFLIVWDVMAFAHRTKITTGPGRGSAAGSLVAYALAITDVDPLQYDLLFERFLNPERIQMPDIDLDFPDNRRDEVLAYVHQKYGHDRVAQIITFGTLAARQAINDVANVLQVPKYQLGELQQMIRHQTRGNQKLTLAQIVKASQPLQNLMADDELIHLVVTTAEQLEGLPRNASTHAAGVVLADEPLIQTVPLQTGRDNGILVTQFPKDPVEALGLLKMDFLGLRNLSIVDATLKLIRQTEPAFTLAGLDLNDRATLQLFQQGETDGVFQFESSGIRRVLKQLRPDRFEDIVAVNALYRPGPMDNIAHFIARKHGQAPINYPAPQLAPTLAPTYGILVYQEQVMQVAVTLASFSLGQADMLRRAMGKKKQSVMEAMRDQFLQGAQQRGIDQAVAMQVFDYMDRFANYGFNRSHAVAYSKMAF